MQLIFEGYITKNMPVELHYSGGFEYLSSINPVFNMRITYTKEDMASRVCMTSLPPRCKADG